jgi:hypothetical protein
MSLADRVALTARILACAIAGSMAGFLAWAIGALGLGSIMWAAPFMLVGALFFGLPSFGVLIAIGLLFARSIRRHTTGWCLGLPLVALLGWRIYDSKVGFPADGTALIGLCAIASSAMFYAWDRYADAPRSDAAA